MMVFQEDGGGGGCRACVRARRGEYKNDIFYIMYVYRRLFATGKGHPHLLCRTRRIRENPATLERSERQRRRRSVDKGEKLGTNV